MRAFAALCREAEAVDFRTTGLMASISGMGNRTPLTPRDARLRVPCWACRCPMTGPRCSAPLTAVALGAANVVADLERQGVGIEQLVVAGGILKNPMWLDATIDAIGGSPRG